MVIVFQRAHFENIDGKRKKTAIIVTELPYQVNKATLIEKIALLVNEKRLEGIADLRDESDRDGIRIVLELKRDTNPDIVLNNLYKTTQMQVTFHGNMLALTKDGKQPAKLTLKQVLQEFINFRFYTIRRRTSNTLVKLKERKHICLKLLQIGP